MATQQMHAQMGGAVAGSEELIPAGAVTFGLMYRTGVGEKGDEGICIHVYGCWLASGPDLAALPAAPGFSWAIGTSPSPRSPIRTLGCLRRSESAILVERPERA